MECSPVCVNFAKSDGGPRIVCITVSTGYADVLEFCLRYNRPYFGSWIIVTDRSDEATRRLATEYRCDTLFYDFQESGAVFDKGGAISLAQRFVYSHFPNSWYLILDSDIVLSTSFLLVLEEIESLDESAIYGCGLRLDFKRSSDLFKRRGWRFYRWGEELHGYFHLYKRQFFYSLSFNAGKCDIDFVKLFDIRLVLNSFNCFHLGLKCNWDARRGSGFIVDTPAIAGSIELSNII